MQNNYPGRRGSMVLLVLASLGFVGCEGGSSGSSSGKGGAGDQLEELPADCPAWEDGYSPCQTCGEEPVKWFQRFPSELAEHIEPKTYDGPCPASEQIDFESFGEAAPRYQREYEVMEWAAGGASSKLECKYFVRDDDSRDHCD